VDNTNAVSPDLSIAQNGNKSVGSSSVEHFVKLLALTPNVSFLVIA